MPSSRNFNVVITLMSDVQIDNIVAAFVRRGRQVKAAASSGNLFVSEDNALSTNAAVVMAVNVTGNFNDDESKARDELRDELLTLLKGLKVKYYSYVIFQPTLACWNMGNVEFPKPQEKTEQGPYR